MRILIAGSPKTGTTGLFYKIRNSMGGDPRLLFEEPEPYKHEPDDDKRGVLAKVVINPDTEDLYPYRGFDYKIAIIRDPRDTLISRLMYGLGYHSPYDRDDRMVAQMYVFLKKMEESRGAMSVLDLIRFDWSLRGIEPSNDNIRQQYSLEWLRMLQFYSKYSNFFPFKYEDFVAGNMDPLSQYLGIELNGSSDVDQKHERVVRTKASGDWKHWLRQEDVELFKPIYQDFIVKHDYDPEWTPDESPNIDPRFASEYFFRLINEKRAIILRPVSRDTLLKLGMGSSASGA